MIDLRQRLSRDLLDADYDALSPQKKSAIDLIADQRPSGIDPQLSDGRTKWDKLADSVAQVGGSWRFIIGFLSGLLAWISLNAALSGPGLAFDPYPFIFLNLILSMIAALQAPIIMMSQNRQSAKDRAAAEHDYVVNLRAELEIMLLHDKVEDMRDRDIVARSEALGRQILSLQEQISALSSAIEAGTIDKQDGPQRG
jgi:uncharacterized membrane protein